MREFIFLNFLDRFIGSDQVLSWGAEQHLHPVALLICCEIGEHIPDLNQKLEMPFMNLVALDLQGQNAYGISWNLGEQRVIPLDFYGAFNSQAWFVFERDSQALSL